MSPRTPYPITPIGDFIGFVLSVLPLLSHRRMQSWNIGIWMYAFWIGSMNFSNFVKTIIWHDNYEIVIPVWCDLVTKLQTGTAIGVPACTMVLALHLFNISRMRAVFSTDEAKKRRRSLIFDLSITLGLPVIIMALWIIVQPYRFEIDEEQGCTTTSYSFVTYIINYVPQLVLILIATFLAPFTLQRFLRHRREMNEFLCSHSNVTPNRYIRVMAITCLTIVLDLPILIINITRQLVMGKESGYNQPYVSWAYVHNGADGALEGAGLSQILQLSVDDWGWSMWRILNVKWNEWIYVLHAVVFFALFGTTPEAKRNYRVAVQYVFNALNFKKENAKITTTASNMKFASDTSVQRNRGSASFSFFNSHSNESDSRTASLPSVV
ncbi:fungal pheromone STE3G-protein-coupled receptor [Schizopora paradoxa]|uniref:Fungal pheromone STE3G-protein-coupled receptor n=1 Tax=Schizopora paradoxa TaxID=27342 RepID=A0A0H2SB28_9AGAM|nr:fungal pheromone STE3G-protein-coupled receptor [Schizopora paradoxa]